MLPLSRLLGSSVALTMVAGCATGESSSRPYDGRDAQAADAKPDGGSAGADGAADARLDAVPDVSHDAPRDVAGEAQDATNDVGVGRDAGCRAGRCA